MTAPVVDAETLRALLDAHARLVSALAAHAESPPPAAAPDPDGPDPVEWGKETALREVERVLFEMNQHERVGNRTTAEQVREVCRTAIAARQWHESASHRGQMLDDARALLAYSLLPAADRGAVEAFAQRIRDFLENPPAWDGRHRG